MGESARFIKLKELLLEQDREAHKETLEKIEELTFLINTRKKLELKVDPIVDAKIKSFQESIPSTLGPTITAALKTQIAEAQDDIVEVLAPIIGKMIKKFVALEMQILSEKIDSQFKKAFSFTRFKSWFGGVKESDVMLRELSAPNLEEIFIIEKESGILKGNYSRSETVDKDMISGMLTAIKLFVEDAFSKGAEELEMIEYESYKIHIFNYNSFFIAVVVSGVVTAEFKSKLQDLVLSFLEKYMLNKKQIKKHKHEGFISEKLKEHFNQSEI